MSYMDGSSLSGFMVRDLMYFGDQWHIGYDSFDFVFGCVSYES